MSKKRTHSKEDGTARLVFYLMVFIAVSLGVFYLVVSPIDLKKDCNPLIDAACSCPSKPSDILNKNLLIVDTTDELRKGKIADIQELIVNFASAPKSFKQWIQDSKKPDQTSVYLVSSTAPPDMQPIAIFCTQIPWISNIVGNTGRKIREIESSNRKKISEAINKIEHGTSATQSPIVEALTILTGNSASWRPGGTIILASDLIQNTETCGYFERLNSIPKVANSSKACQNEISKLREQIRPNSTYKNPTVVAICEIPGKKHKDGLRAFWREIFQDALEYDVLFSCDSNDILNRRTQLSVNRL